MKKTFSKILIITRDILLLLLIALLFSQSVWTPQDIGDRARIYTRSFEFDYFYWTLSSLWEKGNQFSLQAVRFIPQEEQHQAVLDFMYLVQEINNVESVIEQTYSNPDVKNPQQAAEPLLLRKGRLEALFNQRGPLVESILQTQIGTILSQLELDVAGTPFPPILYHMTTLPVQLIISPRNIIREDASISLQPDLSLQQMIDLEKKVEDNLNVSALIVPLGGVGVYPTMVYRTSDLTYLIETIAHEWTHNYLTLHPLGWLYDASPQLRTMNETTASISGKEISQLVLQRFYPELVSPAQPSYPQPIQISSIQRQEQEPQFDYQKEMHATRVHVDELLAQGKIDEAESYMETRRQVFWDNGYQIRKLNQAYFAFYGAYAENEFGPAGQDPVGAAVRQLKSQSVSLTVFLNKMAWMRSFGDLEKALQSR